MNHSVSSMPLVCFHIKLGQLTSTGLVRQAVEAEGTDRIPSLYASAAALAQESYKSSSMNGFSRFSKHVGRTKSMPIFPDASVSYS